ncbi:hypothetical protein CHS0354_034082, partial [Potamilus streckersoni]
HTLPLEAEYYASPEFDPTSLCGESRGSDVGKVSHGTDSETEGSDLKRRERNEIQTSHKHTNPDKHNKEVRTCTSTHVKLDFVLSLSALNERLAVMFYSSNPINVSTIMVCNPNSWTCSPPKSNLQIRINGSGIYITLNSVQMSDQGVYGVIGSRSLIKYPSAVLTVTECISSPPASDMPLKTIELPNSTTQETQVVNTGISYSHAISTSAVPAAGKLEVHKYLASDIPTNLRKL